MKTRGLPLALGITLLLAGTAYVAHRLEPAGARMAKAADLFLATLSPPQKAKTLFAFDDPERMRWDFVPLQDKQGRPTRKGLSFEDMSEAQRQAALNLLKAALSPTGYDKATTIMSLESILRELETKGRLVRDADWYFFSIFGNPGKIGRWGWRVEGHHLSLNFTLDGGQVAASTPAFFGANPAEVKDGPKKGRRILSPAEDMARGLFLSLDADQRKTVLQPSQFPEIQSRTPAPKPGPPRGLAGAKMSGSQRELLVKLIENYASRMPEDIAEAELAEVEKEGMDKVYFAYAGKPEPGQPHSYRVQGPTFVIEYLNVQSDSAGNPANHIHSAWRNIKGDFGIGR